MVYEESGTVHMQAAASGTASVAANLAASGGTAVVGVAFTSHVSVAVPEPALHPAHIHGDVVGGGVVFGVAVAALYPVTRTIVEQIHQRRRPSPPSQRLSRDEPSTTLA